MAVVDLDERVFGSEGMLVAVSDEEEAIGGVGNGLVKCGGVGGCGNEGVINNGIGRFSRCSGWSLKRRGWSGFRVGCWLKSRIEEMMVVGVAS